MPPVLPDQLVDVVLEVFYFGRKFTRVESGFLDGSIYLRIDGSVLVRGIAGGVHQNKTGNQGSNARMVGGQKTSKMRDGGEHGLFH